MMETKGNIITADQCDQTGRFLKFSATNFLKKVAQLLSDFLGYYEKHHFRYN